MLFNVSSCFIFSVVRVSISCAKTDFLRHTDMARSFGQTRASESVAGSLHCGDRGILFVFQPARLLFVALSAGARAAHRRMAAKGIVVECRQPERRAGRIASGVLLGLASSCSSCALIFSCRRICFQRERTSATCSQRIRGNYRLSLGHMQDLTIDVVRVVPCATGGVWRGHAASEPDLIGSFAAGDWL